MQFKKISIEDKSRIDKYLVAADRLSCEYCFADLYMWKDKYTTEYTIEDDWLYIRQYNEEDNEFYYYVPMRIDTNNSKNKEELKECINKVIVHAIDNNYRLSFGNINEDALRIFEEDYSNIFTVENIPDYSDYIYNSSDLINLSGKKFHKKKNLINKFKREYDGRWEYKALTSADYENVLRFNEKWCELNQEKDIDDMKEETLAIKSALSNFEALNMQGGILLVDGQIIAYTLGCESNKKVFVVQTEKALSTYVGAYQMINNLFAIHNASSYQYINREEDLGIEGIRQAKLSYNPVIMEVYYVAAANFEQIKKREMVYFKSCLKGIDLDDKIC